MMEALGYTFRIFVTSLTDRPEELWRDSNQHADIENKSLN